ncbi:MAG TPA: nuclear transport factor 2 family protein [Cyclobacteriaceae bacterium]|nr:nuclear transport factor 2 family protein [Cyclobacteriaceae bacterium]
MKLTLLLFLLSISCFAQEDKKIMATINTLFDGMKKGDSALVHSVFSPQAKLFTVATDSKTGQPVLRSSEMKNFYVAVGTPHKEVFNELIWSPKIEIDGNLAQVWVPYAFYRDKTFSHCGIDAFQLFRDASGNWKIFHLADTRQKEGCVIPGEVSEKMK